MEVTRNPTSGDYVLQTWVRQCDTDGCNNILGSFFEDTRINYEPTTTALEPHLQQSFKLTGSLNSDFDRFLFGFTSAVEAGDGQEITIKNFQLSFIRANDPVIDP
jgi:hypothetical protein